jgi:mono/diheme cytochrome c family protein
MGLNLFLILLTFMLAMGLCWLTWRAQQSPHRLRRWLTLAAGGLLTGALALVAGVLAAGAYKAYVPRTTPVRPVTLAGTPEQIARGRYLADTFCASCHGQDGDLPLTGGFDLGTDIPIPLGQYVAANLTPAGRIAAWSDADVFRAIRHGIAPDGELLYVMWTARSRNLSDADIDAVIAYLRNAPAAGETSPSRPDAYSLLGLAMLGAGQLPEGDPFETGAITAPPVADTPEYGAYIVSYQDCVICHGPDLGGGTPGQLAPIGPSLEIVRSWTGGEFIATLRTGVDPNGHVLNPNLMPYETLGRMTDTELTALYRFITK